MIINLFPKHFYVFQIFLKSQYYPNFLVPMKLYSY